MKPPSVPCLEKEPPCNETYRAHDGTRRTASERQVVAPTSAGNRLMTPDSRLPDRGPRMSAVSEPSRYELLNDDPRFALSKGDVLICKSMHWAWAPEKVAIVQRESDGYEPGCSQYRVNVRHLSGPKS